MISYLYEPKIRSGMGGFQKVFELASQFESTHRVTLFLPAYSRRQADLDCVWIPTLNLPLLRLVSFNCLLIPLLLARALAGRPHVIYLRIFNSFTAPLLARLLGATFVIEFNGNPLQYYEAKSVWRGQWVRRLIAWNLQRADRIVALTKGLQSEINSDFGVDSSKVYVAPSGSNPEVFFPRRRAECRQELGVTQDAIVAVFTGTFFPYQGIKVLLEALTDPRLKILHTWLLGEGIMRKEWESQAASLGLKQVWFTGQVDYSRVPLFLGAADLCLAPFAPNRGEVSPLKVIDYLFCARPTVIARIPAVENLLKEFSSLLSFTPGDPCSLADTMCTMIERRSDFAGQAQADCELARLHYSWEKIARRVEENCFR
ncbi:MAG: glycosyltransferase [Acidobacteriota bacterium]